MAASLLPGDRPVAARLEVGPDPRAVLTDGTQTIEAYATQGDTHTDELLVFYLPKSKILVEADAYNPPAVGAPGVGEIARHAELERALPECLGAERDSGKGGGS